MGQHNLLTTSDNPGLCAASLGGSEGKVLIFRQIAKVAHSTHMDGNPSDSSCAYVTAELDSKGVITQTPAHEIPFPNCILHVLFDKPSRGSGFLSNAGREHDQV